MVFKHRVASGGKTTNDSNMAMESMNDKLSIKNLLFTKSISNYVTPVPINGHKVYACTDCGDKFVLESSYDDHVNRKSLTITYMCRYCGQTKIFYNRCNLLCHIRSHSFKTATINVTDLKIDPLPLSFLKMSLVSSSNSSHKAAHPESSQKQNVVTTCPECKKVITGAGPAYKDRGSHFMQFTNKVYTCPICLFALPTECGLKIHLRLHLKCAPYYCPECGIHLQNKSVQYPYTHDCEGFKMMRVTSRLQCPISKCHLFHPNDYKEHMKMNHLKKVYKCPFCVVACFNEVTMQKHLFIHKTEIKALVFYQCELCPGRLVLQNHMDHHLRGHVCTNVFPCWTCGTVCKDVPGLLGHHTKKHREKTEIINELFSSIINLSKGHTRKQRTYRVVKRCDQCKRSFIYKCKYDEIGVLPNVCPYKCSTSLQSQIESEVSENTNSQIICQLCKTEISQDWEEIKKHYVTHHKNYRCLDVKIELKRVDLTKYVTPEKTMKARQVGKRTKKVSRTKKRQQNIKVIDIIDDTQPTPSTSNIVTDELSCNKCDQKCESKESLESHMITHRDPCMAYQCMECGQSFVVKPSFSTHLLLVHNIANAEEYINNKQCYNANALSKYQPNDEIHEPLCENQCSICREKFENLEDFQKHFRVHGMAFLMKNTSNKN